MAEAPASYQSTSDMDVARGFGKRFFVLEAGRTHGTHRDYVTRLSRIGHNEVSSPAESDYIVVFCPIASRVGTDVGEALESLPVGKPTILVVMHHTFNPDHVVADSRRQVTNPNVRLTVDCLFYEGKLLSCNRNDIAWYEIQKALGVPVSQVSEQSCSNCDWIMKNPWVLVAVILGAAVLIAVIVIVYEVEKK